MNQISPKIFEAIKLGTALVLFEGRYSDVVVADQHFIPLKKDFSNIDDVLAKLEDLEYLEQLVQRAYSDVIENGKYSYAGFVQGFDDVLAQIRAVCGTFSSSVAVEAQMIEQDYLPATRTRISRTPVEPAQSFVRVQVSMPRSWLDVGVLKYELMLRKRKARARIAEALPVAVRKRLRSLLQAFS